jgi:hypothetical protein
MPNRTEIATPRSERMGTANPNTKRKKYKRPKGSWESTIGSLVELKNPSGAKKIAKEIQPMMDRQKILVQIILNVIDFISISLLG